MHCAARARLALASQQVRHEGWYPSQPRSRSWQRHASHTELLDYHVSHISYMYVWCMLISWSAFVQVTVEGGSSLQEVARVFRGAGGPKERASLLLQAAQQLPPFPEQHRDAAHRVMGCTSQVCKGGRMQGWICSIKESGQYGRGTIVGVHGLPPPASWAAPPRSAGVRMQQRNAAMQGSVAGGVLNAVMGCRCEGLEVVSTATHVQGKLCLWCLNL